MSVKNILTGIAFGIILLLLIVGLNMKDKMNNYLSNSMMNQLSEKVKKEELNLIDSLYNYSLNGRDYQITFLEFGAEACISCRKMKKVMKAVKQNFPQQVNVVFVNTLVPENQNLMKFYGVVRIPTQILLDKNGKEYYRHSAYISFEDLSKKFK